MNPTLDISNSIRVGYGHDIHQLYSGYPLVLGGVDVPAESGFNTHSDGDVLCRAIIDAMAGAMADGDLGTHFPEDDPDAEDAVSLEFVREFGRYVREKGFNVGNVDSFITLGTIRLRPYLDQMRHNVAEALGVEPGRVSIKARSNDGLGDEGKGVLRAPRQLSSYFCVTRLARL